MEPATKPTEPSTSLGHITTDEERSFRGRHADVRQKARQVLEDLLEGNARFRKVGEQHNEECQISIAFTRNKFAP